MKIAIVVYDLNIKGGTQRQALELAVNLKKLGHEVDVFTCFYDKEKCYTDLCEQLNIIYVNLGTQSYRPISKIKRRLKILNLSQELKELQKLIIENQNKYDVINLHDYEVYKIAKNIKHQNIVWMLNDIPRESLINMTKKNKKILRFINAILIKFEVGNIKKIVVLDNRVKENLKKYYNLTSEVVRSGIDLSMFPNINRNNSFKKNDIKIFSSSIFFPHRRFEDIVDAIEIIKNRQKDIKISIIINGRVDRHNEYYQFIKNRIEEKGVNDLIKIKEGLSEYDLKNHYLDADLFIFPNHKQTWGLAVFEAMLAGCVCLVSKTSGAHEVLTHEENAILINPKSPEEIANHIINLAENPDKMKRISINARNFVENNISWEKYSQNMITLFQNNE